MSRSPWASTVRVCFFEASSTRPPRRCSASSSMRHSMMVARSSDCPDRRHRPDVLRQVRDPRAVGCRTPLLQERCGFPSRRRAERCATSLRDHRHDRDPQRGRQHRRPTLTSREAKLETHAPARRTRGGSPLPPGNAGRPATVSRLCTGCGAAWLARSVRDAEAPGSNPGTPTLLTRTFTAETALRSRSGHIGSAARRRARPRVSRREPRSPPGTTCA